MRILPDPSSCKSRWKAQADRVNAEQPTQDIIQTFKDGSTRVRVMQTKLVSCSVRKTGRDLIGLFIGRLHKAHRLLGESAFEKGLPGLLTTRAELADLWGCSERTAYNHLVRLQEAGLVTKRRFRGSKAAFEVHLETKILYGEKSVETSVFQAPTPSIQTEISQILPHSNTRVTNRVTIKTETIKGSGKVDNRATDQSHILQSNIKNQSNTERQQPQNGPQTAINAQGEHRVTKGGRGAAAAVDNSESLKTAKGVIRTPEQKRAIFEGYLTSFWNYAKQLLYAGRSFTTQQEMMALQEISAGVYNNFHIDFTEKEWDGYQAELFRRIELASKYYERHSDKYAPDPYSRLTPGAGYFCQENLRGFRNTDNWLAANIEKTRQSYAQQRLTKAIGWMQKHKHGRAPKRLQAKTYLEAFLYLENQMKTHGSAIHEQFLKAVSAVSKPVSTAGFTKQIQTRK